MPKKNELLLLQKLADNTSCLLSQANNQEWILRHLAATIKYLYSYRLKLNDFTFTVKKVFAQLQNLQTYLHSANTRFVGYPIEIHSHILKLYENALTIASALKLQKEYNALCAQQADFLQIPTIQQQTTSITIIAPDYKKILQSLNIYCQSLKSAQQKANSKKIAKFTQKIDVLETRFLFNMLGTNIPTSKLIKNLAYKLYKNQTGNPDFTQGLLQIFNAVLQRSPNKQNLELLVFLSSLTFPDTPYEQSISDWQSYRDRLQKYRVEFASEVSPTNMLVAQHNFTRKMQEFTRIILQECFDLLEPPNTPLRICFLMLGSMSRMDMQPYSDFEYALLEDNTYDLCLLSSPPSDELQDSFKRPTYILTTDTMSYFDGRRIIAISISPTNLAMLKAKLNNTDDEGLKELSDQQLQDIATISGYSPASNQEYIEKLLELFEFKINSLGEQNLSRPGEYTHTGFHLDNEGHPGKTSHSSNPERFRGTPQKMLELCQEHWQQSWTDPDNFCHLQISYSLLHAGYLLGDENLWQEYQQKLVNLLTPELRKQLAKQYLQFHSAEFMAEPITARVKIKDLVIAPLLYLLQNISLYKIPSYPYTHDVLSILEILIAQKIIHADFALDCSRILNFTQFLRYQEQCHLQGQIKPELVANSEELEDALALIRATHEVTDFLSLNTTTSFSITGLNIASLPFDPLVLKLYVFEQRQQNKKTEFCPIDEPLIPIELKNRIRTLALYQLNPLKYKEYYVKLPTKTLRETMLRFIENYESKSRSQAIWEMLARYPNCDGTRPFVEWEEQQWIAALSHLFATNDQDASSAILSVVYMDNAKTGRLHHNVFNCLVDKENPKQPKLKTQSCSGTHLVLPIQIANNLFHFKFYPENPGYEIAAARLHKLVIGHGASQSVLARLELLGSTYPVLISKTVVGQDLSLVLYNEPDTPLTLDAKLYSQLFLISLLLQPEDGKPDNYVFQEITIDGHKIYTLICIDNDHVFARPIKETSWRSSKQIFTKTIIYCLDQLRTQPLHTEAIEEFLLLKPIYLLGFWLKELQKYAKGWDTLFSEPESEKYAQMPKLNQQSLLRLKLPLGLMGHLYQQFFTIQEILTICKKQQIPITHYELLKRKNKKLAKFYKQLFINFKTPKQRFSEIARLYYNKKCTQEIVRYQSRIDSRQMLTLSFGIRTNLLELIRQGGYTIGLSQQELEIIAHRYKTRKEALAHLESGDKELIQRELNILQKIPKTEVGVFLSRIINHLNFAKVLPQFHATILNLLNGVLIDKLLLRNCSTLTDGLLLTIMNKQPTLRMLEIQNCSNLHNIILPFLPNLTSLNIKGCITLLSITMLTIDSRSLEKLKALEIIECPQIHSMQIPIPNWQLKHQFVFKNYSYYIHKYRIIVEELFAQYTKMCINEILLNIYRELSISSVIITHKLNKKIMTLITQYLVICENRYISVLIQALQDQAWNVRSNAVQALGKLGNTDERVISHLIKALQDQAWNVRSNAIKALGRLGKNNERVIATLIKTLQDQDWYVRSNAAKTLIKLGKTNEYLIITLIEALQNQDDNIRSNAIKTLIKLGKTDKSVIATLIKALQDQDSNIRSNAAEALGKLGNTDERIITALIKALQDHDSKVHNKVAAALGNLGNTDERVIATLVKALQNDNCDVRREAIEALRRLGNSDKLVIAALIKALQDQKWHVRREAAITLEKLGKADKQVIAFLIKALQDQDSNVRSNAAEALGRLGNSDKLVIAALIKALQDQKWHVRLHATKALGKLNNNDECVIVALVKALQDQDSKVRIEAAVALERLEKADEHVITALIKAMQDQDSKVRLKVTEALGKLTTINEHLILVLIKNLQDKNSDIRKNAIETLGRLGNTDERVITALIKTLQDESWFVRSNTVEALEKLCATEERVITALIKVLQDKDWDVRTKTIKALGKLGTNDERVITALINVLLDKNIDIRSKAIAALSKLLLPQNYFAAQIRQIVTPYIPSEHRPMRFFGSTRLIPTITSFIMQNIVTQLNLNNLPIQQQRQFFALSRVSKSWYRLFQDPTLITQREATKKLLEIQSYITAIPSVNSTQVKIILTKSTSTATQHHSHPGLQHQKIVGDGNCLYRAITLYLSKNEDIAFLRQIVATNLEEHAAEYKGFIPLQEGQSLQDYIEKIRNTREWAGNVEINILMRLLKRPIIIIGPDGQLRNIEEVNQYKELGEPIFVYYNGENHYDALILAAGCDGKIILAELLNSAPMVPQSSEIPKRTTPSL